MKKLILLLLLIASISAANAQIADPDTLRDPVKQGDPDVRITPPQALYRKEMTVIKQAQLPAAVKKSLQGSEYKGWEKATIYRNASSTLYLVEIQEPAKTRVYRFDKNGKRLDDE